MKTPSAHFTRREFVATAASVAGALALLKPTSLIAAPPPPASGRSVAGLRAPKLDIVRWGIIGLWERGLPTLEDMLQIEGSEVRAICDPYGPAIEKALGLVEKHGKAKPAVYADGEKDYLNLVARDDLDAVMICTPWRTHVPMALAAMQAGKHAFIEVPAAITVEECWQLVDAAERHQLHCMMLENCCYGRDELMLLRLCREGMFGDLLHGEGAYLHDLRPQLKQLDHGEGTWRPLEFTRRNGNLYPTHGLGPVAQYMGINTGDRFESLISFSSPARGLTEYAAANFPPDHPRNQVKYICGDLNTSIIKTTLGRTIVVQHDTSNAHPYSRGNLIQGTKGLYAGYPARIYVEDRSPEHDRWEMDPVKWREQYDHPLWVKGQKEAIRMTGSAGGHGGMDFVMRWRIMQCLREGLPLDQSVYDAAAWSVVGPLSEQSVAAGGAPVAFPDFTRGGWRNTPPLGIVS